jgi:hypothetical protein
MAVTKAIARLLEAGGGCRRCAPLSGTPTRSRLIRCWVACSLSSPHSGLVMKNSASLSCTGAGVAKPTIHRPLGELAE